MEREAAPEPPDPDKKLLAECEMEFVRAGGPGGQHRNRRETGVRLKHLPTGVLAQATERRSQAANRKLALERLAAKLAARRKRRKPRRKTVKPKGIRERELKAKKVRSERKAGRGRIRPED